jgi:glycerophosphoryl diester phosphodiesterase
MTFSKNIYLSVFFILFACSCKKNSNGVAKQNTGAIALGHGGMGINHIYPLNSYESIAYCLNLGADGTELDLDMTKDSVLVAFHDLELSDMTNLSGKIYDKNWTEIENAQFKDPTYAGYRLSTLKMLFSSINKPNEKIFAFDCKNYNPDTSASYRYRFCRELLKIIDEYHLNERSFIQLKREELIVTMKSLRPDVQIYIYADYQQGVELALKHQLQGIVVPVEDISEEQVNCAHALRIRIAVYNANSKKTNLEALAKNVDIIESGSIRHLLKVLK